MEMSICFPNLKLEFDYVGRAFSIFGFEITIYGLLISVGMLLGIFYVVQEAKRNNRNQDRYLEVILVSLTAAVVGARLFYVIFSWGIYKSNPMAVFNLRGGGYSIYGGLLGGFLAAGACCRGFRMPFAETADTAVLGILIGQAIGRWGNFFNRESFGAYTDSLFAMELPLASVRSSDVTAVMREKLIVRDGISFISVHPVFLYESIWCLILFCFILIMRRKKRFQGEMLMLYLAGYGLGRFFFEYLRTDSLLISGTRIPVGIVISAVFVFVLFPMICVRRIMVKKRADVRKKSRERKMRDLFLHRQAVEADAGSREKTSFEAKTAAEEERSEEQKTDTGNVVDDSADRKMLLEEEWEKSEHAHINRGPNA